MPCWPYWSLHGKQWQVHTVPQNLRPGLKQHMRTLAHWTSFNSKKWHHQDWSQAEFWQPQQHLCGSFGSFRVMTTGCLGSGMQAQRLPDFTVVLTLNCKKKEMLWRFFTLGTLLIVYLMLQCSVSGSMGALISGRYWGYPPWKPSCWHDNDCPWSLSLLVQQGIQNGFVGLQVCFLWNAKSLWDHFRITPTRMVGIWNQWRQTNSKPTGSFSGDVQGDPQWFHWFGCRAGDLFSLWLPVNIT